MIVRTGSTRSELTVLLVTSLSAPNASCAVFGNLFSACIFSGTSSTVPSSSTVIVFSPEPGVLIRLPKSSVTVSFILSVPAALAAFFSSDKVIIGAFAGVKSSDTILALSIRITLVNVSVNTALFVDHSGITISI